MMGVGPGDNYNPSFNNAADFQAIRACGAEPVFVGVNENTLCIDPPGLRSSYRKQSASLPWTMTFSFVSTICIEISQRSGIPVLHDAAHSFGSSYKGVPIGNQHQYTMFSFDPVKTITCIDGGAIVVNGEDAVKRLQAKRLIGMTQPAAQMYTNSRAWTYDMEELGFRYHMANLHAAIGVSQIKKINEIRETRQQPVALLPELAALDWIDAPVGEFDAVNPFLYYIQVLNGQRDKLRSI